MMQDGRLHHPQDTMCTNEEIRETYRTAIEEPSKDACQSSASPTGA